eukprot:194596-Prorocentrum_minimum.AAC.6
MSRQLVVAIGAGCERGEPALGNGETDGLFRSVPVPVCILPVCIGGRWLTIRFDNMGMPPVIAAELRQRVRGYSDFPHLIGQYEHIFRNLLEPIRHQHRMTRLRPYLARFGVQFNKVRQLAYIFFS